MDTIILTAYNLKTTCKKSILLLSIYLNLFPKHWKSDISPSATE